MWMCRDTNGEQGTPRRRTPATQAASPALEPRTCIWHLTSSMGHSTMAVIPPAAEPHTAAEGVRSSMMSGAMPSSRRMRRMASKESKSDNVAKPSKPAATPYELEQQELLRKRIEQRVLEGTRSTAQPPGTGVESKLLRHCAKTPIGLAPIYTHTLLIRCAYTPLQTASGPENACGSFLAKTSKLHKCLILGIKTTIL